MKFLPVAAVVGWLLVSSTSTAVHPPITSVTFTPDGKSVVACSQAGVQLYSWPALKPQRELSISAPNPHDVAFSSSGDRLAIAGGTPSDDGTVELLSWPGGESIQLLDGHTDSTMKVVWLGSQSLASVALDHQVIVWNAAKGSAEIRLTGHSRGVVAACLLDDRKTLVSAGIDRSLRVWDVGSGELIHSLSIHTQPIHDLALRPGDHGLPMICSVSDDRTIRFWQPTIGRMVRFARLSSVPLAVDWVPDGSSAVVSCVDGRVRVVDPDTVEVTQQIAAIDGWAYDIAVHPSDSTAVVAGQDGQIRRIVFEE